MIVKDEAPIIERLVDSVAPVVSYYVVCDTGSSDNTIDILRARFAERGIDGEVHNVPFVNFSQARNTALRFGRDSRANFDYFLLADADMELVVEDHRFPERLSADAYSIRQHSGTLSYTSTCKRSK
jgi:glycosyltransferase involved in cell wall biosynthesis